MRNWEFKLEEAGEYKCKRGHAKYKQEIEDYLCKFTRLCQSIFAFSFVILKEEKKKSGTERKNFEALREKISEIF